MGFAASSSHAYGFDKYDPSRGSIEADYAYLMGLYKVRYVSLKANEEGKVLATFEPNQPQDPAFTRDKIRFVGSDGKTLTSTYDAASKQWNLTLPAAPTGESEVFSYYQAATGGAKSVGKLLVKRWAVKEKIVQIINLANGAIPADLEAQLNKIYAPALLRWKVEVKKNNVYFDFGADNDGGALQVGDRALLSNYSAEMKALMAAYFGGEKNEANDERLYVFLVPKFSDGSVEGYMPRGRNVGFMSELSGWTLAHELGHGWAGLAHTFPALPKGSTSNLMDYSQKPDLTAAQWGKIQNPGIVLNWFDDEDDAMFLNFLVGGIIGGFADGVSQFAINFIDDYDDNKSIAAISAAAARKISVPQVLIAVGAGAISSGLSSEASVAKFATRLASNVKVQAAIITGIEAGLDFIIGVTGDQVNNYFKDKTSKQTGQQIVIDNLLSSSLFTAGSAMMKTKLGKNVKGWLLKKLGNVFRPLLDDAGELTVGEFGDLSPLYNAGLNSLTAHHIPSNAYMLNLVARGLLSSSDYDKYGKRGLCVVTESSIVKGEVSIARHGRTKTFGGNMTAAERNNYLSLSPKQALEFDINDLRNIYKADGVYDLDVESALKDLINRTKAKYKPLFD